MIMILIVKEELKMSKPIVTVDNLNEEHFSLDTENRIISVSLPELEIVDDLVTDDDELPVSAAIGKELKEYIDNTDSVFLNMVDAFDEPIFENGILPPYID